MRELTKAEEEVMQILWDKHPSFAKDIVDEFPEPRPAYNTVSTIIRILETKGFIDHEAFGRTHRYFPIISKTAYSSFTANKLVNGYFGNSISALVSHFVQDQKLDLKEMDQIMEILKNAKS